MRRARLAARKEWIAEGDWTAESGQRCMSALRGLSERPTAVFIANFLMKTGALSSLKQHGVAVPSEMQAVSSDDWECLDVFTPGISTIVQPSYEMGKGAAAGCRCWPASTWTFPS